jgi:NTP pyrophosphatase (non-canonical NTP hydrolase)
MTKELTLNAYQAQAKTTALYPQEQGLIYTTLGLAGEAGEIANKVKKILRGDTTAAEIKAELEQELGDVLWYVALVAEELGLELNSIGQANLDKLASRAERDQLRGSGDDR